MLVNLTGGAGTSNTLTTKGTKNTKRGKVYHEEHEGNEGFSGGCTRRCSPATAGSVDTSLTRSVFGLRRTCAALF